MEKYLPFYKNRTTENLFAEVWKPVIGYEGYYECSNYARIKSLFDKLNRRRDYILSQFHDKDGYLLASLCAHGRRQQVRVHTVIGNVFKENPFGKPIFNHNDGVKTNNLPYNLIPATHSENTYHAYSTGLMKDCNAKITRDQVLEIVKSTNTLNKLSSTYGITRSAIWNIKHGRNWSNITGITRKIQ